MQKWNSLTGLQFKPFSEKIDPSKSIFSKSAAKPDANQKKLEKGEYIDFDKNMKFDPTDVYLSEKVANF